MQMNEQVLTALEVLRNFAENDLERHRIDVLEKDLTAPPKVEQIGDKYQNFNGVSYCKDKKGHYLKVESIQQAIYRYYIGEIPKGNYEIHHRDWDKSNNDISNLQLLTSSEHIKIHRDYLKSCRKISLVKCTQCGKQFESKSNGVKSANHFCSKECRNTYFANHLKKIEYKKTCQYCGLEFYASKVNTKFCSYSCSAKFRENQKKNNNINE